MIRIILIILHSFYYLEKETAEEKLGEIAEEAIADQLERREIQWRSVILGFVMVFLRAIEIFLRSGGNDSSRTSLSFSIRKQRPGLCRWKIICFFLRCNN